MVAMPSSGEPELDAHGNHTTVTYVNGYDQFTNLMPDVYSIVDATRELYPASTRRDHRTGSPDGLVDSYTYKSLYEGTLSTLSALTTVSPLRIMLDAGLRGRFLQFSHVLLQTLVHAISPPSLPPSPAALALPMALPAAGLQLPCTSLTSRRKAGCGRCRAVLLVRTISVGTEHHRSAGQPRRDGSGYEYADAPQYTASPTWSLGAERRFGTIAWILADENGALLTTVHFGMPGSIPVAGDWNGDGTPEDRRVPRRPLVPRSQRRRRLGRQRPVGPAGHEGRPAGHRRLGRRRQDRHRHLRPDLEGDARRWPASPASPTPHNPPQGPPKNIPPDPQDAADGMRTMKKSPHGKMRADVIDHVFRYGDAGDSPWSAIGTAPASTPSASSATARGIST